MVTTVIPVEPFDLVIFGGTGDLARRKLLPALFQRWRARQMPENARVICVGRQPLSDESYRNRIETSFREFPVPCVEDREALGEFLNGICYARVDVNGSDGWSELRRMLRQDVIRAFYLSVAPSLFGVITAMATEWKLVSPDCRIVVEKPFGHDLASARNLNAELSGRFDERQIYRIDHYLGKETVQNLMALRFGNSLFEPIWNSQYVDHIQISVAESGGIGGRGSYYDEAGAMRDMVQNHLMQLLCLIAMEPPAQFEADAIRDEKLKVIKSLGRVAKDDVVRGQYLSGPGVASYRDECGDPVSETESFVALRVHLDNWRWSGTPFYLRTGKRLRSTLTEVSVAFKDPVHWIFEEQANRKGTSLTIRLQPNEGITMRMTIKDPGPGGMRLTEVPLDMTFAEALGSNAEAMPNAYERLVMDVIRGNQTLFMRGDEVEAAWAWIDPIAAGWADLPGGLYMYDPGSDGPVQSHALLHRDRRDWQGL